MSLMIALFYAGGIAASDSHNFGFWASIFWPWYAGKAAFDYVAKVSK